MSCILLFSCVTVFGFTDVDENSEYYEAVNFMYEKGIIGGYGDGTFRPDNPISYNELAALLTKSSDIYDKYLTVFDLPHPHWATSYLIFARTQGFFNVSEILYGKAEECVKPISKGMALRGMFGMLGLEMYDYRFYELDIADIEECESDNVKNAVVLANVLGLIEKDENNELGVSENITRGEVCNILYELLEMKEKGELKVVAPEIIEDLNIVLDDNISEKGKIHIINELAMMPLDIIKKFNQMNWALYVTNKDLSDIYDISGDPDLRNAVGLCSYRNKSLYVTYKILLNMTPTLLHEFGHFAEYAYFNTVSDESRIKNLYEEEKVKLTDICGRDYCETNDAEFFAEAFKNYTAYIYYLRLSDRKYEFENFTPETYKFFTDFFTTIDKGFKEDIEQLIVVEEETEGDLEVVEGIEENTEAETYETLA